MESHSRKIPKRKMEIKVGTGDLEIVTYNVGIMSVDKEEEEVWEDGDCEI